jgi:iron complex transport system substrate-binding protein
MKRASSIALFAFWLASTSSLCAKEYPQRIITLSPHLAEMVDAAGAADRLVGVSAFSNYPNQVKKLPVTSDAQSIDLEGISKLKPDLILYWENGTPANQVASVKKVFGTSIQIRSVNPRTLNDIASDIEMIGAITGTQKIALKNSRQLKADIAQLKNKYSQSNKTKVKVFYQIWAQPLMTLNHDHLIGDIIQACGAEQLFANEQLLTPTVSREAVIKANPDIIFTGTDSSQGKVDWSIWKSIPNLNATKNNAFIEIDGDIISRPSPRVMQGAQKMCQEIANIRQKKSLVK